MKAGIRVVAAISQAMNGGDIEPLRSFAVSEAQAFRHSLTFQHRYYESELRWKNEFFWRRRRTVYQRHAPDGPLRGPQVIPGRWADDSHFVVSGAG